MFELAFIFAAVLSTVDQAYALLDEVPALVESGEIAAARAKADEALILDPDNFEALSLAAALAERVGEMERALRLQKRLLELDSDADEARLAVARLSLLQGDAEVARAANDSLLERHPHSREGLAMRDAIRTGGSPSAVGPGPKLKPLARLDLTTGYDSNPTLRNENATGGAAPAVASVDVPDVAVLTLDGTIGFYDDRPDRPFTLLGRVTTTRPFDDDPAVGNALASTLGVTAIARRRLSKEIVGLADLRYQSLFVDGFSSFLQHFVAPSVLATYDYGIHQFRGLLGAELRLFDTGVVNDSITPRLAIRDTIRLGNALVVADIGARLGIDLGEDTDDGSRFVGSQELSTLVFGQLPLFDRLTGFAGGDLRFRSFDAFLDGAGDDLSEGETILQLFAGLRYRLDAYEFHAEYGYSRAFAGEAREFDRQQLTAGVRVWYY